MLPPVILSLILCGMESSYALGLTLQTDKAHPHACARNSTNTRACFL